MSKSQDLRETSQFQFQSNLLQIQQVKLRHNAVNLCDLHI